MRRRLATGLVAAGLFLSGCAAPGEAPAPGPAASATAPAPAGSPAPPAGAQDPAGLIGVWTLARTTDDPGGVVRVGENSLKVFRDCAIMDVEWRADVTGLFIASMNGYQLSEQGRACRADTTAPEWVTRAVAFRADGTKRVLLDDRGQTVVEWLPGGKPRAPVDLAPADPEPPVVSDELRRRLSRTATLPAGLTPATPQTLTGRWVPEKAVPAPAREAHIELTADGSWSGSDGCNQNGGRWAAGAGGALLAVAGAQTEIGCDNSDVMAWFTSAAVAGFDGDVLVLVDDAGQGTGRLRREG